MALQNETPISGRVTTIIIAVWIVGTAILFLVNLSTAFYESNRLVIERFLPLIK